MPRLRLLLAASLLLAGLSTAGCLATFADVTGQKAPAAAEDDDGKVDPQTVKDDQRLAPVGKPPVARIRLTGDDGAVLHASPAPDAVTTAVCLVVPQGNLTFSAADSTPGDNATLTAYEWTLTPGGARAGKTFTIPYHGPGGLTVGLKVKDSRGATAARSLCLTTQPQAFSAQFTFTGALDAGIKGVDAFPPKAHPFTLPASRDGWAVRVTSLTLTLATGNATADFALRLADGSGTALGDADNGKAGEGEVLTLTTVNPGDLEALVSMTGAKGAYTLTVDALLEEAFPAHDDSGMGPHAH